MSNNTYATFVTRRSVVVGHAQLTSDQEDNGERLTIYGQYKRQSHGCFCLIIDRFQLFLEAAVWFAAPDSSTFRIQGLFQKAF